MPSKVDETGENQDGKQKAETSDSTQDTSQSTQGTQENKETEAKRKSDEKAEEGRAKQLTELKERLERAEGQLQNYRERELESAAESIGKSVEDLKSMGLNTAEKVIEYADFFGITRTEAKPAFRADSGKTVGSGKPSFTREQVADFEFFKENKDAILAAQREGRIR